MVTDGPAVDEEAGVESEVKQGDLFGELPLGGGPALTAEELAAVRQLALKAHPDAVPELIGGASLAELLASVEPAKAAYQRIATAVAAETPPLVVPPVVPAGGAPRLAIDPDDLPATEKIRRGLATRKD